MGSQAALVTGSGRGIGKAIALELAARGFHLAVHDKAHSEELERVRAECEAYGVRATTVCCDLSLADEFGPMIDEAEAGIGPLTTLVSNAGVGALRRVDLLDTRPDSFDHCMLLNARVPMFLLQEFSRRLLSRQRDPSACYSIISVSSVSAVAASTNRIEYCMSKAAAAMMAKTYALRLAAENIQVFDVQPGIIDTDLTRAALPAYRERIQRENLIPDTRIGQVADVARACGAAAAGDLPYTVGQVLRLDGGLLLEKL